LLPAAFSETGDSVQVPLVAHVAVFAAPNERTATVAGTTVHLALLESRANHVVGDVVLLVHFSAILHVRDWDARLLQHLSADLYRAVLLSPAKNGATLVGGHLVLGARQANG